MNLEFNLKKVKIQNMLESLENKKVRLELDKAHRSCSVQKWMTMLLSGESKLNLKGSDGISRVRRPNG